MTRLGFSKYIPDLGLITHYSEFGDSPVHRINPWIKFALLPLIIFDLTVVSSGTLLLFITWLYSFFGWHRRRRLCCSYTGTRRLSSSS